LRNRFSVKYLELENSGAPQEELDQLATGTNRLAAVVGDVENGYVIVGQSLVALNTIQPVGEVMEELMAHAKRILAQAPSLLS